MNRLSNTDKSPTSACVSGLRTRPTGVDTRDSEEPRGLKPAARYRRRASKFSRGQPDTADLGPVPPLMPPGRGVALGPAARRASAIYLALLLVTALCSPALGQYFISSSTVDGGGYMFSEGGGYKLGGTAGQCDAHSSSGGGYTLSGGFWALAPSGPACIVAEAPLADVSTPDAGFGRKNRYVSIVPGNPLEQTALRIEGASWSAWVGPPVEYSENAGKVFPAEAPPGTPTFFAATVQCDAYFTDWTNYPVLHIYHEAIRPGNTYVVQAIHESCDGGLESSYSPPLDTVMSRWGDVVENCAADPCGPPDGVINITTDVTAVLNKFKNLLGAPIKARSDLDFSTPDQLINISDVTLCLDAFGGFPYPYPPVPDPCTAAAAAQLEVASLPYDDLDFAPVATLELVPSRTEVVPGEAVTVDVLLSGAFDLRSYQVTLAVDGGDSGLLYGEDLRIDAQRADFIFGYAPMLSAVDQPGDRIGAVLVSGGVDVVDPAYLGTFTLRATEDASGAFTVYAALENRGSMLNSSDNQPIRFSSPAVEIDVNSLRLPHRSSK